MELESARDEALGQLPPACRASFDLVRTENLSYESAAERLGSDDGGGEGERPSGAADVSVSVGAEGDRVAEAEEERRLANDGGAREAIVGLGVCAVLGAQTASVRVILQEVSQYNALMSFRALSASGCPAAACGTGQRPPKNI